MSTIAHVPHRRRSVPRGSPASTPTRRRWRDPERGVSGSLTAPVGRTPAPTVAAPRTGGTCPSPTAYRREVPTEPATDRPRAKHRRGHHPGPRCRGGSRRRRRRTPSHLLSPERRRRSATGRRARRCRRRPPPADTPPPVAMRWVSRGRGSAPPRGSRTPQSRPDRTRGPQHPRPHPFRHQRGHPPGTSVASAGLRSGWRAWAISDPARGGVPHRSPPRCPRSGGRGFAIASPGRVAASNASAARSLDTRGRCFHRRLSGSASLYRAIFPSSRFAAAR